MLHHLSLPVVDLERAAALYDVALAALGYRRVLDAPGFAGYGVEDGRDKLALKQTARSEAAGPGFHLALAAPSREAVDAFHAAALLHGATDNGRPGLRPHYGPGYYAAFIIDLDGHRIEAVHSGGSRVATANHVPAGWPALIPRIAVDAPEGLVGFIQQVFDAVGRFHPERPSELRIGDSLLMVGSTAGRQPMPAFLYVYVEDTDSAFRRALDRGAESLEEPQDVPYGDRRAMIRDPWGNTWQIATHGGRFTP
jgi:uncharacterized glyoxalase superfamily protein PhnB/catechol 2,3-dioxygenase-like lactoylglutathione lyase family enzyme